MKAKDPIKKLIVTKETVKDLTVRTNIQTGPFVSVSAISHSLPPTLTTSLSHSITSHTSFSI